MADRFWSKVAKSDQGCWLWQAGRTDGYGHFKTDAGRMIVAHRYAYQELVGAIPEGMALDHLCRNRACVNPEHLEPVTWGENTRRGAGAAALRNRELCRNGLHPWPQSARPGSRGKPECRECRRVRQLAYYHRTKATP